MSYKLLYSGGRILLPTEIEGPLIIPTMFAVLEADVDDTETITVRMGTRTWVLECGINTLPIIWTAEGKCSLSICGNSQIYSVSLQRIPGDNIDRDQIINLGSFMEDIRTLWSDNQFSVKDFIEAQRMQQIKLLAVEKPMVNKEDNDNRDHLREVLAQQVQAICSRPKKGTKTEELVQDVGMVKEINTNTLKHLASHTEHWKAKKLTGLEPKRLLSVIIEEDINIYENLFFRMAMDDISDYVARKIRSMRLSFKQAGKITAVNRYNHIDYHRGELLRELMGDEQYADLIKLSDADPNAVALTEWQQIAEIVQSIKNSALYKQIDPRKRISKNIHQTNILRNDQRYKALFQIWQEIRREEKTEKAMKATPDQLPDDPEKCYACFVFLLLIWTLNHKFGIEFSEQDRIMVDDCRVKANLHGQDQRYRYEIGMVYDEFEQPMINLSIAPPYPTFDLPADCKVTNDMVRDFHEWIFIRENKLVIISDPDPVTYGKISRLFIQKAKGTAGQSRQGQIWKTFVLDIQESRRVIKKTDEKRIVIKPLLYSLPYKMEDIESFSKITSNNTSSTTVVWVTATNPDVEPDLERQIIESWTPYVLSYGEMPFKGKTRPYSSMYLPVSQIDLLSAERLEKAIAIHRTISSVEWAEKENKKISHCPSCLSKNIKKYDQNTWGCLDCSRQWGETRCQGKCGRYFFWIAPSPSVYKRLQRNDVERSSLENMRIIQRDTVFGSNIITDFEYESNNAQGSIDKIYPVCPYCGTRRSKLREG